MSSPDTESADRSEPVLPEGWMIGHIIRTMLPLLATLSILQMVSGTVLETFEEQLLTTPSLLVLVPVTIGTAGNLGSIMCSRLSTELHLGTLEFTPDNPAIRSNVGAVMGLAATVFVVLGLSAWAIGQVLGGTLALWKVMLISVTSGMLLAVFVVVVSITAVYSSFRLGYDPDDTTIPVVTNVSDITGVLILFSVVSLVL
jgi:mgtE-like transporter